MRKLLNAIRWIIGVLIILIGVVLLLVSFTSGVLVIISGILVLPAISKVLPKFRGRSIVFRFLAFVLFMAGLFSSTTGDSDSTNIVSETESEENQDDENAQRGDSVNQEEIKSWILENVENTKLSSKDIEKLKKKTDEETFFKVWAQELYQEVKDIEMVYAYSLEPIEKYCSLYETVWENKKNIQNVKDCYENIISANTKKEELEDAYSVDLSSALAITGQFYISQRLEYEYMDNILGKIQKEIESYDEVEGSSWVAHNVEYFYGSPTAGENTYVIYSDKLNAFSQSGAYDICYVDSGETTTLENASGFSFEAPIYNMIDNYSEFTKAQSDWKQYDTIIAGELKELIKELENPEQEQESQSTASSETKSNEPKYSEAEIENMLKTTDLKFPILFQGYAGSTLCPVMVNDENEAATELSMGTYQEMLASCVDDGVTMYAPPNLRNGEIYTATRWDVPDSEWYNDLLTYEAFLNVIERMVIAYEKEGTREYDTTLSWESADQLSAAWSDGTTEISISIYSDFSSGTWEEEIGTWNIQGSDLSGTVHVLGDCGEEIRVKCITEDGAEMELVCFGDSLRVQNIIGDIDIEDGTQLTCIERYQS